MRRAAAPTSAPLAPPHPAPQHRALSGATGLLLHLDLLSRTAAAAAVGPGAALLGVRRGGLASATGSPQLLLGGTAGAQGCGRAPGTQTHVAAGHAHTPCPAQPTAVMRTPQLRSPAPRAQGKRLVCCPHGCSQRCIPCCGAPFRRAAPPLTCPARRRSSEPGPSYGALLDLLAALAAEAADAAAARQAAASKAAALAAPAAGGTRKAAQRPTAATSRVAPPVLTAAPPHAARYAADPLSPSLLGLGAAKGMAAPAGGPGQAAEPRAALRVQVCVWGGGRGRGRG
jgi:hypothetical protein